MNQRPNIRFETAEQRKNAGEVIATEIRQASQRVREMQYMSSALCLFQAMDQLVAGLISLHEFLDFAVRLKKSAPELMEGDVDPLTGLRVLASSDDPQEHEPRTYG